MDLATYIERQLEGVRGALGGLIEGVTVEEWTSAPAPGQNPIGFTAWHVPSIQDWAMNTWMRNRPTVRSRPEWAAKGLDLCFLPFGMPVETTFEVARATAPADVLAYADVVLEEARALLATLTPEMFDTVPDNRAHLADSRFNAAAYQEEIAGMFAQPYWRLFAGAFTGHCRGHIGELELALAVVRNG
jgi:hypothetical protein